MFQEFSTQNRTHAMTVWVYAYALLFQGIVRFQLYLCKDLFSKTVSISCYGY